MARPRPRIAIAQMPMHWTCAENTASILRHLRAAADGGAAICVFPELAVTGFHHRIKDEARTGPVRAALRKIRDLCRERRLACSVGAPLFRRGRAPFNSHVHIDESGTISAVVNKIGLAPGEAKFFAAGRKRPVSALQGRACTSVICREIEDLDRLRIPRASVDFIFWPGYIGKLPDDPPDYESKYLRLAEQLAATSAAWVIQCNWPHALNRPGGTNMGESAVINARGQLQFKLPIDQPGLALFTPGDKECEWQPETSS